MQTEFTMKKIQVFLALALVLHILTYYLLFEEKLEWPSFFTTIVSLFLFYFAFKNLHRIGYFDHHKPLKFGIVAYSLISLLVLVWADVNPSPIPMYRPRTNPFYRSIARSNGFHPWLSLSCASGWWYWEKDKRRRQKNYEEEDG